jgi:hypothetical protein
MEILKYSETCLKEISSERNLQRWMEILKYSETCLKEISSGEWKYLNTVKPAWKKSPAVNGNT